MSEQAGKAGAVEEMATGAASAQTAQGMWFFMAACLCVAAILMYASNLRDAGSLIQFGLPAIAAGMIGLSIRQCRLRSAGTNENCMPASIATLFGLAIVSGTALVSLAFRTKDARLIPAVMRTWTVEVGGIAWMLLAMVLVFGALGALFLRQFRRHGFRLGPRRAPAVAVGGLFAAMLISPTVEFVKDGEHSADPVRVYKLSLAESLVGTRYVLFEVNETAHIRLGDAPFRRSILCPRAARKQFLLFARIDDGATSGGDLGSELGWKGSEPLLDIVGLSAAGEALAKLCEQRSSELATQGKLPEASLLRGDFAAYLNAWRVPSTSVLRPVYFDPKLRQRIVDMRALADPAKQDVPLSSREIAILSGDAAVIRREFAGKQGPLPHERYALFDLGHTDIVERFQAKSVEAIEAEQRETLRKRLEYADRIDSPELARADLLRASMGGYGSPLEARGGYSDADFRLANAHCNLAFAEKLKSVGLMPEAERAFDLVLQNAAALPAETLGALDYPAPVPYPSSGATPARCAQLVRFYADAGVRFSQQGVRGLIDIAAAVQTKLEGDAIAIQATGQAPPERNSLATGEARQPSHSAPAGLAVVVAAETLRAQQMNGAMLCGYLQHLHRLFVRRDGVEPAFEPLLNVPTSWKGKLDADLSQLDGCEVKSFWLPHEPETGTYQGRRKLAQMAQQVLDKAGIRECRANDGGPDPDANRFSARIVCRPR